MIHPHDPSHCLASLCVARMAFSSPTIFKLLPRLRLPLISSAVGITESFQCLNTAFMSRGTPSRTIVVTGMKGRSSSETARMPYSCANIKAVENAGAWLRASAPTILSAVLASEGEG